MRHIKTLSILVFTTVIFLFSCNEKASSTKQETTKPVDIINSTQQTKTTTPPQSKVEPPQNSQGVWHYTCSKGCAGGAGAAESCSNCGNLLAHNSAYHAKTNNTPTTTPLATPYITNPTANNKPKEPSQNLAGVWHYTCGQGCAGGAGSAVSCSNCGNTLAHNTAYHQ